MTNDILNRTAELVKAWNLKRREYDSKNFPHCDPSGSLMYMVTGGSRYIRLVALQGSTVAFVDNETGDIYKSASYKAPAKGVRGSVLADDFGLSCFGPYGVEYLRGPNIGW